jgi:FtsP/CotA-like multicopper oxidase with cupredoxin domain
MSPAERADVIMDFTGMEGRTITLENIGPDEPFGGGVPDVDFPAADPATTGVVMQFIVGPALTPDLSTPIAQLVLPAHTPLSTVDNFVRQVSLNELSSTSVKVPTDPVTGAFIPDANGNVVLDCTNGDFFGPMEAQLGKVDFSGGMVAGTPMMWMDPITENPAVGSTELWEIYNFTMDAHPIHLHQVQFEVVQRQSMANPDLISRPEPWETGLKDTVTAYPDTITRIRAYFDLPGLYVWHCHIVEHEDNEMMRPFYIGPIPPGLLPPMP